MPLSVAPIDELAQSLADAECKRGTIETLSSRYPDLDESDAYAIAKARLRRRRHARSGYKLGYTSAAMRRQMNIAHPNYGVLTGDMFIEGGTIAFSALIHPLVEPEIAIALGRDLAGGGHDRNSVVAAEPLFMAAIEVCDTRYHEYRFKAVDNIADNSSAARYVLGTPMPVTAGCDLRTLVAELWIDDQLTDQGVGANALGDPLLAVAWLANRLHAEGATLKAGEIVLTGGLTRGYLVQRGQQIRSHLVGAGDGTLLFI
jgi:2-keto-4-pentenoate hydratase